MLFGNDHYQRVIGYFESVFISAFKTDYLSTYQPETFSNPFSFMKRRLKRQPPLSWQELMQYQQTHLQSRSSEVFQRLFARQ